ncbi:hypothetical protein D3C71_2113150 [compost metagenome]
MPAFDQGQAPLHRVAQPEHQHDQGDHRQHRTQADGADEQQARQLLVAHHPIEQTQQIVHDQYLL